MRAWIVAAALVCACAPEGSLEGAPAGESYTLEIRASETDQTYLITAPDGRVVGARAAEGASALMNSERARALIDDPPSMDVPPEVLSLRVPGFDLRINAEEGGADGESGRVALSIGAEGQQIVVNAEEGAPGDADNRAYVRISGADEDAVREFVEDADGLSTEVRAEMLAGLGLAATPPEGQQP